MDLLEYQGKQLFARHGVPVPDGRPRDHASRRPWRPPRRSASPAWSRPRSRSAGAARRAASRSPRTPRRRAQHAEAILGMDIRGLTVHELWIEEASDIAAEYYASIVFDRSAKAPLLMLSTKGGMDIEEVADVGPRRDRAPARRPAAGLPGLPRAPPGLRGRRRRRRGAPGRRAAARASTRPSSPRRRCSLEVNPLIVTRDRSVKALDAKVTLDGNSLFRHPDNAELRNPSAEDPQEQMAKERGLTYVKLDGNIGILGNGAGPGDVHARRGRPGRRRARPTSSTPAAAPRPTRSSARSRSSSPTPRSRRCSSTSSAASRAATRWRAA